MSHQVNTLVDEFKKEESEGAYEKNCGHVCSSNCRREGCNCICGEYHAVCEVCGCTGVDENDEQMHWKDCKTLEPADFSGAGDEIGYANDR